MRCLRLVGAAAMVLCGSAAHANTIIQNTAGFNGSYFTPDFLAVGQSVTTPGGGPWDSIEFDFYDTVVENNQIVGIALGSPLAYGTLYLLTQTYAGTTSGLSTLTPGFLAATSTIVNGDWVFDPTVTMEGNIQYYFFTDTISTGRVALSENYSGGTAIETFPTSSYQPSAHDAAFLLQGVSVPEPSSVLLVGMGLFAVGSRRWRKRNRGRLDLL